MKKFLPQIFVGVSEVVIDYVHAIGAGGLGFDLRLVKLTQCCQ